MTEHQAFTPSLRYIRDYSFYKFIIMRLIYKVSFESKVLILGTLVNYWHKTICLIENFYSNKIPNEILYPSGNHPLTPLYFLSCIHNYFTYSTTNHNYHCRNGHAKTSNILMMGRCAVFRGKIFSDFVPFVVKVVFKVLKILFFLHFQIFKGDTPTQLTQTISSKFKINKSQFLKF